MDFDVNFLEITANAKRGASGAASVEAGCCVAIEFRTARLFHDRTTLPHPAADCICSKLESGPERELIISDF